MKTKPTLSDFKTTYDRGQAQVIWTELAADLETPVSAKMKLARDDQGGMSFLLESVEGGAIRGRYSFIGFRPDIVWRCLAIARKSIAVRSPTAMPLPPARFPNNRARWTACVRWNLNRA